MRGALAWSRMVGDSNPRCLSALQFSRLLPSTARATIHYSVEAGISPSTLSINTPVLNVVATSYHAGRPSVNSPKVTIVTYSAQHPKRNPTSEGAETRGRPYHMLSTMVPSACTERSCA